MTRAYLSLGSNLGHREEHLAAGIAVVAAGEPCRVSPVYETSPVGGVAQGPFLNVVVELRTEATPHELLERCRAAEAAAQQVRTVRNGPRTLDADVLLVGDLVVDDAELTVPHPRMYQRRFVLQPLADLDASLVDPDLLAAAEGEVVLVGTLSGFH